MSELRNRRYVSGVNETEIRLPAGDVTEGVVRIGDTVRRPHQPQSYAVAAYLDHLQQRGFEGAPRFLGRDSSGRDVLTFLEGDVAGATIEDRFLGDELLVSVARLVHALHEAASGYRPLAEPFPVRPATQEPVELVGHLDVTPQNVVVRDGVAFGLIDFDLAGETTRFRDSYNAAMHWVPLRAAADLSAGIERTDQLRRLRLFADAYDWTEQQRLDLPRFGAAAAATSRERMKLRAEEYGGGWARMWDEGVGDLIARRGRWLIDNQRAIVTALVGQRG
ncbi:MAG: hypothetical protein ACOH1Y_07335 [Propionicimonas sp.]